MPSTVIGCASRTGHLLDVHVEIRRDFLDVVQVFQLLQAEESPHTVRAWFVGLNPQLDDVAPAEAIRAGQLRDVLVAARAYVSGG